MQNAPDLTPVREHHRFDEGALAEYLSQHLGGDFGAMQVRQFEGGQSNPTFLIEAGGERFVMRKKPPGKLLKSAHAVDREYRIMNALRDTEVPVPRMRLMCDNAEVIGTEFFVMDHVEGRVITEIDFPNFSPEERESLYFDFARTLAALHAVDYVAVGLEDYGRPGNYFERQISRWSKQYDQSRTEDVPAMDALLEWLPANIPTGDESTVVHGDYRTGNCIIHPTEPKVAAVLDWELSTIGHPLGDLGYCCMVYHHFRGEIADFPGEASGIPSEEAFLEAYCTAADRDPIENWPFYIVYNLFRSAAIMQGVYRRGLDGNASSEGWRWYGDEYKRAAASGWAIVQGERS